MTTFNNLPLELLPGVLRNVVQPRILASFCLVNKVFCKFTQPFLYHTISVYPWHHKEKIVKLFLTLSSSLELAKHVWELEIRDFPLGLDDLRRRNLIDLCVRGLANTVNLRRFIWTRDGSLTSSILLAIVKHPSLQELEINGRQHGNYEHTILPQFTSIRRIKLIMPTPPVVGILPAWLESLTGTLQGLSIVCMSSTDFTDPFLEKISENLSGLDELHLAGCQRVTHEGLMNALRHNNKNGIKSLSLENISPSLDLQEFGRQCRKAHLLNRLTFLTISIGHGLSRSAWTKDIPELVSSSPLEYFQLYCTTVIEGLKGIQLDDFVKTLVSTHGPRLKRFSIHRLPVSLEAFHSVCTGFTNLEHLFALVEPTDLGLIGNSLSKAPKLQAVHINFVTIRGDGIDSSCASPEDVLQIVKRCSSTVTQIGCGSRVWQVVREIAQVGENAKIVELSPHERSEVPDQFQVVRV